MRPDERDALRVRFVFRCGYCGIRETDVGAPLTVDHFQPRSRGGQDEPDNLIYACHACNEFKSDYWRPEAAERIPHPLHDDLTQHIVERPDGLLEALTDTGAFHIHKLRLNRAGLVAHRLERRVATSESQERADLSQRVAQLEAGMAEIGERVESLERQFGALE